MPSWNEDRPAAGGALFAELADRLPAGARVLIAGPHADALIDAVHARTALTCLVRSQPDAITLDARGVDVLCGTLAKLNHAGEYDAVLALDGLDRLCSVEGPQYDWTESLRVLKRALRPGGLLMLAVENELGVHRLVDPATPTSAQTDEAWRPLGEFDTKPGNPTRLAAVLAAEELAVDWLAAAWPLPGAPTLLATPNALTDGPVDALAAVAAGAVGRAYAERSVLSDPRRLAAGAVRAGLGPEFAAAWLVVAHRAPRPAAAVTLPPVLIGDGPVLELAPGPDGGWQRRVVHGASDVGPGGLDGPLPVGRLLEELLLAAALRHDLPALRRLLTGWTAALPDVSADNVVVHGDAYARLDPSVPSPGDVLRRFARTLIAGTYAHPWPAATDVGTLTTILHGAAGLADPPAAGAGSPLPTDSATGDSGTGDSGTGDSATLVDSPARIDSRREHEEQVRALRRQLADAASRAQWYEQELDKRDGQLRKAQVQIAAFSGNVGYRVAKLGFKAAKKARNRLRKGLS